MVLKKPFPKETIRMVLEGNLNCLRRGQPAVAELVEKQSFSTT